MALNASSPADAPAAAIAAQPSTQLLVREQTRTAYEGSLSACALTASGAPVVGSVKTSFRRGEEASEK